MGRYPPPEQERKLNLNSYTFHINLYDLAFLGAIFTGLTFALLLYFTKTVNRSANRFLALALVTMVLWMMRILAIDIRLETYLPWWNRLPMQFLLALGPLLYFYVLKITRPAYQFRRKDLLHFSPLLLEQAALVPEIRQNSSTVLQLLTFISIITYLHFSDKLIRNFYRRLQPVLMDRSLLEFRWLRRLLGTTALLWLLWLFCAAIDYFGYRNQLGIHVYYPFYTFFVIIIIWTAAAAFLKPQAAVMAQATAVSKPSVPAELRAKGAWLKRAMDANHYHQDPELSLGSLAEKLSLPPHELSRVINTVFKKGFNDFINEYRVMDAVRKMQDPAYAHITLLGIAFEAGFNSKTTFNRIFKEMTGKSPTAYKKHLEKEGPTYKLGRQPRPELLILNREPPQKWVPEKLNSRYMFRNYVKVAIRNLQRNKGFTAINVIGLSIGLATCLLIVFYVADEWGYDKYNTKANNIYRADMEVKFGHNANSYAAVQSGFADEVKKDFTTVEQVVRLRPAYEQPAGFHVKKGSSVLQETSVIYADASLFKVFTLPMITGNPATALAEPNAAVLTESLAKKFFDAVNIVGQTLVLNDTLTFKVTGVIKDLPEQSHFNYHMFLSMETLPNSRNPNWGGGGYNTYLLLKPGANTAAISKKLSSVAMEFMAPWMGKDDYLKYTLTPLTSIHLHSNLQQELGHNGSIQYVYIFSAIGLFILLIACVNFMNLSTARSSNRAKEVGVRKVLGSPRKHLIAQFLTESLLVTFASTIIAIIIAWLFMPLFSRVSGKQLAFSWQTFAWLVPCSLVLTVIIGFIAGSYPAFFLSRFQPINVLKGKFSAGFKGGSLRSFLVVFQFGISIFLIIGTLVIYNQLHYIQTTNLGYNRKQVLIIKNTERLSNQAQTFKQQIKQLPDVEDASFSGFVPTGTASSITALFPDVTLTSHTSMLTEFWPVDEDYIKTMGMQLKAGRNFSPGMRTDSSSVIINEAAAKFFGFKDPLNKTIYRNTNGVQPFKIIGVIKDFHFKSLRQNITPVVLYLAEDKGALNVKLNTASISNLMGKIKDKWKAVAPDQQLTYSFMDAEFDAAYRAEDRIGVIFMAFTFLAIVIACLGLFGLATYAAEQRTKEIGIRKVMGAGVPTLVGMLSKDFLKLVLIAIVIASPIAWFAMQQWLHDFAYRTTMHWWLIAVAGITAIVIAFATVSFQAIKASLVNPVKSLRAE